LTRFDFVSMRGTTMISPQPIEEGEKVVGSTRNDTIRKQVVHSLGTPGDLLSVQVRPVGGERFRVNVVVGKDFGSSRIPNSFFLTADAVGNILTSSPKIDRQY